MKRIIFTLGLFLTLNIVLFADDVIDYNYDGTWYLESDNLIITETGFIDGGYDDGIDADGSIYSITNYGLIFSWETAINADEMIGDIYNYGSIISSDYYTIDAEGMIGDIYNYGSIASNEYGEEAIDAEEMAGNIYNYGSIISISEYYEAIDAEDMIGNIYNYGTITSINEAINADYMKGDIYNYASIMSGDNAIDAAEMEGNIYNYASIISNDDYGIYASSMLGNIINHGTIIGDGNAIYASWMEGDIYNFGTIKSINNTGINAYFFTGTIYNYGTIEGGEGDAIYGAGTLNIVGNGKFIGRIVNGGEGGGKLYLTNDVDGTVLDLSQARLALWEQIYLLGGEMIITQVGGPNASINQTGADTYIHLGRRDLDYYLAAGVLNPYNDDTPYRILRFDTLNVVAGATLEMNFGLADLNDHNSDKIIFTNDGAYGYAADGTILRLLPGEILDVGQYYYTLFDKDMYFDADLIIEIPLLYTVDDISEDQYDYTISRKDESYTKYATTYNKGFASFLNSTDNEDADNIKLELEQAFNTDDFNAVLEPYNMAAYASLANNNINYISTRTNKLFNILSNGSGAETTASNTPIGSGYATANPGVKRDSNGNNIWFDVYMSDSSLDGEDGYELESDGYEVAFGIDKEINANMILGLGLHYSDFESDVSGGLPVDVDIEGLGLSVYGQYSQGSLTHKAIIGYTNYSNDANRAGAEADFDSSEFYLAYRAEYLIKKESFDIIPIAGLTYSHISYDDIVENGGANGLEGYDYDSLQSELGVKLVKQLNALGLNVGVSWIHELMDTESDAKGTSEFGSYSQDGIERDEDIFRASIGVDYQLTEKINFGLEYAKEFGDNTDSDAIEAKISFSF